MIQQLEEPLSHDLVKRTGGPRKNTTRGVLVGAGIGLTIGVMAGAIAIVVGVGPVSSFVLA